MPAYTKCPFCGQLEYELQPQTPQEKANNEPREWECRACAFTGRCSVCGHEADPKQIEHPQVCIDSHCLAEAREWEKADEQIGAYR